MKRLRRMITFAIILVVLLSFNIVKSESETVENNADADILFEMGLLNGTDKGLELNRVPTRIEGLIMLLRLLGEEDEVVDYVSVTSLPFEDVPGWATSYVHYAYDQGLTKGISETAFGSALDMGAKSYMTLVLRALDFDDSKGDFMWDNAIDKGRELGIIDASMMLEEKTFNRGDMATLSVMALRTAMKMGDVTLAESLVASGDVDLDLMIALNIIGDGNGLEGTVPVTSVGGASDTRNSTDEYSILEAGAIADAGLSGTSINGTDATAAFQYAVDHYETVIIPEGNYRISRTVYVNQPVTIVAKGGIIYADAVEGNKMGIFDVKEGGSGSVFQGLDVRSVDAFTPYMPNDTPSSITSNRIFINGDNAKDVLIKACSTLNLMYSVQGFGMDNLEVDQCSFEHNYINVWLGDGSHINIHDTYLSTSLTADVYAHCIYIGYDIYDLRISDITVQQTSEACGAILNFAWLGGDASEYFIHGVVVDGVKILPSETINSVIQSYGVEDALFRNITGTILENSNDGARHSMFKGGKANGTIIFEDCEVTFEALSTIIRSANTYVSENESVSFLNCIFNIETMESQFLQSYVNNVTFEGCTLDFGEKTFNKNWGLYSRGVHISFKDCDITWASDFFLLTATQNDIKDYGLEVVIDGCDFIGETINVNTYVMKNCDGQSIVFTNNYSVGMFEEGRLTSTIDCLISSSDLAEIDYQFSNNRFEWR